MSAPIPTHPAHTDPAGFAFASESAGGGGEMSTAAKAPRGGARGARTPSPMEADEEDDSQVERSVSGYERGREWGRIYLSLVSAGLS